jgi:hypothetical protein
MKKSVMTLAIIGLIYLAKVKYKPADYLIGVWVSKT